jgi:hypothetical protein
VLLRCGQVIDCRGFERTDIGLLPFSKGQGVLRLSTPRPLKMKVERLSETCEISNPAGVHYNSEDLKPQQKFWF